VILGILPVDVRHSDHVKSQIEALCTEQTKIVVLDAEISPYVDVPAATMLVELRSILTRRGARLRTSRPRAALGLAQSAVIAHAWHVAWATTAR
jgi:MFS superfamily sulfate permease-like transporter